MKIRKNDLVQITAGKDRGKQGRVERVFASTGAALVPGMNQYKKHRKPAGEGRPGEILTLSRPVPAGNLALVCPKCRQVTRVGYRRDGDKKIRVCRKCGQDIA